MSTAALSTLVSHRASRPAIPAATAAIHDAQQALIVAAIARLNLPPFPTRLVGKERLSPTDLRRKAALAVYGVIPGLSAATVGEIATATKLSPKDTRIAVKDLITCGVIEQCGVLMTAYRMRSAQ